MKRLIITIFAAFALLNCSRDEKHSNSSRENIQQAEYIYRTHQEYLFLPEPPLPQTPDPYPWEKDNLCKYPKITKEFFRCKGSSLNPQRTVQKKGEVERYFDCSGVDKHSLPLKGDKEFVYPILIDLVNYIQIKTGKRVVITSGHRCPEHNMYIDPSPENQYSKHQIGAEVSFYVQGMEGNPEMIVECLQNYYLEKPEYSGLKEYQEFSRYEGTTNVSITPWMNKEIFIKLYSKKEGRNLDNRHPYPYISVQVRYDRERGERVVYTWEKAHRNYLRK